MEAIVNRNNVRDRIRTTIIMVQLEKMLPGGLLIRHLLRVSQVGQHIQLQVGQAIIITLHHPDPVEVPVITLRDQAQAAVQGHRPVLHVLLQVHQDLATAGDNIQFSDEILYINDLHVSQL